MADRIEIETNLLTQDKETIQNQVRVLKSRMAGLKDQMERLSGMWEGPAKETFMIQFWSDCDFIQDFFSEMDAYVDAMEYARQEYEKCENNVSQIVASIRI